jgi:hypothetical protein
LLAMLLPWQTSLVDAPCESRSKCTHQVLQEVQGQIITLFPLRIGFQWTSLNGSKNTGYSMIDVGNS